MVQFLHTLLLSVVEIPPSFPVNGSHPVANNSHTVANNSHTVANNSHTVAKHNKYSWVANSPEDQSLKQGLLAAQEIQEPTPRPSPSSLNVSRSSV
jgi:hypothetical protein